MFHSGFLLTLGGQLKLILIWIEERHEKFAIVHLLVCPFLHMTRLICTLCVITRCWIDLFEVSRTWKDISVDLHKLARKFSYISSAKMRPFPLSKWWWSPSKESKIEICGKTTEIWDKDIASSKQNRKGNRIYMFYVWKANEWSEWSDNLFEIYLPKKFSQRSCGFTRKWIPPVVLIFPPEVSNY